MSTTATSPLRLADAEALAVRFIAELAGTYERIAVAGSVCRRRPLVKDIEIVAVPKIEERHERDLFGEIASTAQVDLLDARLRTLVDNDIVEPRTLPGGRTAWGTAARRAAWGPLAKMLSYEGAAIDLFTPCAERFGWILALRTGPADFSAALVTPIGTRSRRGRPGLLPETLRSRNGWLTDRTSGKLLPTPEEEDVFRLLGLPYLEPWER